MVSLRLTLSLTLTLTLTLNSDYTTLLVISWNNWFHNFTVTYTFYCQSEIISWDKWKIFSICRSPTQFVALAKSLLAGLCTLISIKQTGWCYRNAWCFTSLRKPNRGPGRRLRMIFFVYCIASLFYYVFVLSPAPMWYIILLLWCDIFNLQVWATAYCAGLPQLVALAKSLLARACTISIKQTGWCYRNAWASLLWGSLIVRGDHLQKAQAEDCAWFSSFIVLLHCFIMYLCCLLPLHDILSYNYGVI